MNTLRIERDARGVAMIALNRPEVHNAFDEVMIREVIEAFRDLGDDNGHLWGHVQAIKRPTLLEITGPLMMSFAVASNLQYRLKEIDGGTLITLRHTALGLFPDGYRDALSQGWPLLFDRVRRRVEKA